MRTASRLESSQPYTDAFVSVFPSDVNLSVSIGVSPLLKRLAGPPILWTLNQQDSTSIVYGVSIAKLLRRTGMAPDLQEMFGTAAGVAGPSLVSGTGPPSSVEGRPPFTGASQLVPPVGYMAKGFKLINVIFAYSIVTANLIAHTCRIDQTTWPSPSANTPTLTQTSLLANGTNGLQTGFSPNYLMTQVSLPTSGFLITDNSDVVIEQAVQANTTGSFNWLGMWLHFQYNYS